MKKILPILFLLLLLCGCVVRPASQNTADVSDSVTPEAFLSLVMDLGVAEVTVQPGDDWGVEYKLPAAPEITQDNDTLRIRDLTEHRNFSLGEKDYYVRVTVPEGIDLQHVELRSGVGDLKLQNLNVAEGVIELGVGEVELEHMAVSTLSIETGTGDIALEDVDVTVMSAESGTGSIELDLIGAPEDYSLDLSTGVGSVEVADRDQGTKHFTQGGEKTVKAMTGVGDIDVEFQG